jgi:WD40 repeat protein
LHFDSQPRSVSYRPDGEELAVLLADGQIVEVDTRTISVRTSWSNEVAHPKNTDFIWNGTIEFDPTAKSLITYQTDAAVRVWDAAAGTLRYKIDQHLDRCVGVALSPDAKHLATASLDTTARVWDFSTGRPVSPPLSHSDKVSSARFHPQGELLVTSGRDRQVRVWKWRTGEQICEPIPHLHEVHAAAFSPDGRFLITASEDKTVRICEWDTGKLVTPPIPLAGPALNLEFSPDGRRLVVGGFPSGPMYLISLDKLFAADRLDPQQRRVYAELSADRAAESNGTLSYQDGQRWLNTWRALRAQSLPIFD